MRYLWSLVVLGVALACTPAQAPAPTIDLDAEQASLLEADEGWSVSYAASDDPMGALVERFENDGVMLAPDVPLATGAEAIRAVLAPMANAEVHWQPTTAVVSASADLGHTVGSYEMTLRNPEGRLVKIEGKYLTVWRKQADGSWKVAADAFNPNGPPTAVEED